ncbi:ion transporter [Aquisalibacillus elongatus]|uniref:Voltage-gated sodium channel n=1 Tax=Aquisalibacillus elongatus TaxID=485577 RepID=A0A3N5BFC9_9BACI|nr:ion transporter [Aquisalibacillus elongatus]RPF53980.1 voltage-gated sodium channel [Aquisalibacillus elongatus]
MQAWSKRVVENKAFQNFIIALILLNAVLIGMETYPSLYQSYGTILQVLDIIILAIFTIEIALKLIASEPTGKFFKDGWNVFDFLIVAFSYIFVGSTYVTVLRILRVLRLFRTISVIPSLRKLVNALLMTLPSLGTIMLLLTIVFYIFSVIGTVLYSDVSTEYFGTIQHTALTLFQMITLESWASGVMRPVMEEAPYSWIYFVSFILAGSFVVLNLFVGVIVNNFEKVEAMESDEEEDDLKEEISQLRREIKELKDYMKNS